jgi:Septum formation
VTTAARAGRIWRRVVPVTLLAVVTLAGCSSGPERDPETGELLEAGDVDVFELRVGDCLSGFADDAQVSTIHAVPCGEEHTDEIYAEVPIPDGDGDGEYPGDDAIVELANTGCYDRFAEFIGLSWEDSELDFGFLAPTEQSWEEGDRQVLCLVGDPTRPLTGTLEGAAR